MSLQSRLSLAAKVAQACADLQEQRNRRVKATDPVMNEALAHLDAGIAQLALTVAILAGADESGEPSPD